MGNLGARLTTPAGVIVAGGQATRHGGVAKGLLEVGGIRIIDRVAAALSSATAEIFVAASSTGASSWLPGARVVRDVLEGGGAASGIHAALRANRSPILAVGWDMPFVSSHLLRLILDHVHGEEFDAVVPSGAGSHTLEPLCAWYAPAVADAIETQWSMGRRGLHDLLAGLKTYIVPVDAIATIGAPERLFFNVNTPDDLATANAMLANT